MDIHERWEEISVNEYIEFERVENKRSSRPDMHAFMLLDELFPGSSDMVCHAEHDNIWLDVEDEDVERLTDEQIVELSRCGVMHDSDGGLWMFT